MVDFAGNCIQCPKRPRTKVFPSPNSNLSSKKLEQQQRCIEAANNLLRTLGNPQDPENTTALRLRFRTLRGMDVQLAVECHKEQEILAGRLEEAGRDFLQLSKPGKKIFVLYERICSVCREKDQVHEDEQELIHIDPSLRQALVRFFGRVVSDDPFLFNLFFGIPLHRQLVGFLGSEVRVKTEDEEITGLLVNSKEEQIELLAENQFISVNLQDICFLEIGC